MFYAHSGTKSPLNEKSKLEIKLKDKNLLNRVDLGCIAVDIKSLYLKGNKMHDLWFPLEKRKGQKEHFFIYNFS